MILRATSFVIPLGVLSPGPGDDDLEPVFLCEPIERLEFDFVLAFWGKTGPNSAAAPLSAVATWSTGTCHVARYNGSYERGDRSTKSTGKAWSAFLHERCCSANVP